ncbi:MAG: FAD:protein FMN transferase [Bacteroidales bacterium]|nr:FAD:protein FMN transferase [Bacteroidales bacterium]
MRNLPFIFAITLLAAVTGMTSCSDAPRYEVFTGYAQGGQYRVKFNARTADGRLLDAAKVKEDVDSILNVIDNSLSGYNDSSILTAFNDGRTVVPDYTFIDICSKSYDVWKMTSGTVDVALGPVFDIWGFGFKSGSLPSDAQIDSVRSESGLDRLDMDLAKFLDSDGRLNPSSMLKEGTGALPKLNFNAVAQGYTADVVADYLKSLGVRDMLVDIGEIFCCGLNPEGHPWTLGIDAPVDGNNNPGAMVQATFHAPPHPCGIVTSGNYRKFYVRDGRKYAHTIDPRTCRPVEHSLLCATVIAPDSFTADALATCCMVLGPDDSKSLILNDSSLEGCLIYEEEGSMKVWASPGFEITSSPVEVLR